MAKKLFTKSIIAVLLLSMLLALAACGGDPATTTKKSGGTTTDPVAEDYPSQLVGMKDKTKGETITFLYTEGGNGTYTADSIWADPNKTAYDDIENAVIERNNRIKEDLGVDIFAYTDESIGIAGLYGYAQDAFNRQDTDFDVYCGYQYFDISAATSKNLYNLNTLKNDQGENIIDISQPYWATNYINSITYNDLLYWVTGDLSFRYTGGLYCTFVNVDLYDQYVKNAYNGKSIYQVVNEGNWTMQTMLDMASRCSNDTTGDGLTEDDRLGMVVESNDMVDGIAFGCKVEFGRKTKDDQGNDEVTIHLNLDTKAAELANYLETLINNDEYTYIAPESDAKNMMRIFSQGNTLFAVNKLYMSPVWLSEMKSLAVIPTPKLNASQENYASGVHDSVTIFGISKYSERAEAAAATLELMAYYGNKIVNPKFYDNVLKGSRTVRDEEAAKMIDIIRAGFDTDFVAAWSASINDIVHSYRDFDNLGSKFSSNIKRNAAFNWPKSLSDLVEKLQEASAE